MRSIELEMKLVMLKGNIGRVGNAQHGENTEVNYP